MENGKDNEMNHINYERRVALRNRLTLDQLFPSRYVSGNFAVLCGDHGQRREIALQALRQYVGKVGIIFIHNDPMLSSDLRTLVENQHGTNLHYANPDLYTQRNYDPLYGLSEARVLEALVPYSADSAHYQDMTVLRSHLQDYLSIMKYQFNQSRRYFGDYPYNLDLLMQLAQMPYPDLKTEVLDYLPDTMRRYLEASLAKDSVQYNVMAVLRNFATMAEEHLWTPTNAAAHSRLSIVSVVRRGDIISVRVPNSDPTLMNYIDLELEELNHNATSYLLVESGLNLHSSRKIASRFLGEHSHLNYRTGIVTQSPASILSADSDDLSNLFSEYQEIVVLACSSKTEAELFSSSMGSYYRIVSSQVRNTSRRMFSLFPTHTNGVERHEVEERNIRPEEILNLSDGALLLGQNHDDPVIVSHLVR